MPDENLKGFLHTKDDKGGSSCSEFKELPTMGSQDGSNLVADVAVAPEGNLILEVRSEGRHARFRVFSQVLCLVSPVFRAMLGPSSMFKEARELHASTSGYKLSLEDDNPEALAVILYALHCRTERVPCSVSFEDLFNMAIICDKYDCVLAVAVWVDIWTSEWKKHALETTFSEWMFISWTFRLWRVFEPLSRKIVMEGRYESESGQLLWGNRSLDAVMVPDIVISAVVRLRSDTIKAILDAALTYLVLYSNAPKSVCRYRTPNPRCDVTILGSLVREFLKRGLNEPESFLLMSVEEAVASIKGIHIYFYKTHEATCSFLPKLFTKIEEICKDVKGLKLESFTKGVAWEHTRAGMGEY